MKTIEFACSAVLLIATAACATPDEATATASPEIEESRAEQDRTEMPLDDVDDDGVKETLTAKASLCGTGGCTWKIHLSKLGDAGELFALDVQPLPKGYEQVAASLVAHSRGGVCLHYLDFFDYEEGRGYVRKSSVDCFDVAVRNAQGQAIAQFEGKCLDLVGPACIGQ